MLDAFQKLLMRFNLSEPRVPRTWLFGSLISQNLAEAGTIDSVG